jgi:hypothetical protein
MELRDARLRWCVRERNLVDSVLTRHRPKAHSQRTSDSRCTTNRRCEAVAAMSFHGYVNRHTVTELLYQLIC